MLFGNKGCEICIPSNDCSNDWGVWACTGVASKGLYDGAGRLVAVLADVGVWACGSFEAKESPIVSLLDGAPKRSVEVCSVFVVVLLGASGNATLAEVFLADLIGGSSLDCGLFLPCFTRYSTASSKLPLSLCKTYEFWSSSLNPISLRVWIFSRRASFTQGAVESEAALVGVSRSTSSKSVEAIPNAPSNVGATVIFFFSLVDKG